MNRFISCGGIRASWSWRLQLRTPRPRSRSSATHFRPAPSKAACSTTASAPVVGAMVSVVGRTTAAATTDRDGRYALKRAAVRSVRPERALARLLAVARPHGPAHHAKVLRSGGPACARSADKTPVRLPAVAEAAGTAGRRSWPVSASCGARAASRLPRDSVLPAASTSTETAEDRRAERRWRRNRVAAAASAAQHSEGCRDRDAVWAVERRSSRAAPTGSAAPSTVGPDGAVQRSRRCPARST